MPRYWYVVIILLGSSGQSWGASWADQLFSERARDFGSVPSGTVATHPFRVTNNTKQTVHISGVRVSCGCVSARAMAHTLQPGASTAIMCRMDTGRYYGSKTVTVYVTFDRPGYDEVRLSVSGYSRHDLVMLPDKLEFGKVTQGASPKKSVEVSLIGGTSPRIVSSQSDSHYVKVQAKRTTNDSGETIYRVSAQLRPDTPAGKWFTDIWLKTNEASMPRIRVPLSVQVAKAESPPAPKMITLGQLKRGMQTDRKLILRGNAPFRIVKIRGNDQQFAVRADSDKKSVHELTVSVRPAQAGQLQRRIEVLTDLDTQPKVEFMATARVVD